MKKNDNKSLLKEISSLRKRNKKYVRNNSKLILQLQKENNNLLLKLKTCENKLHESYKYRNGLEIQCTNLRAWLDISQSENIKSLIEARRVSKINDLYKSRNKYYNKIAIVSYLAMIFLFCLLLFCLNIN